MAAAAKRAATAALWGAVFGRPPAMSAAATDAVVAGWAMLSSPAAAELLCVAGYETVCVDLQHGYAGDTESVYHMIRAVQGAGRGTVPGARVPNGSEALVHSLCEAGAGVVIGAECDSAADALALARSCAPRPEGTRSFAPSRATLLRPDAPPRPVCMAQIETLGGLASVEAIAATPGLDALFVGPMDLSLALGRPPAATAAGLHASVLAEIWRIRDAAHSAGAAAAIFCADGRSAAHFAAEGFDLAVASADVFLLLEAAKKERRAGKRRPK